MTEKQSYTAYIPTDDIDEDDLVIARNLSGSEAMKIAFGYGDGWRIHVHEEHYGSFLHYELRAYPNRKQPDLSQTERLHATVLRTSDPARDKSAAMEMIAAQFIRFNHRYWAGRVESNESYDKRERRVAEKGKCGASTRRSRPSSSTRCWRTATPSPAI